MRTSRARRAAFPDAEPMSRSTTSTRPLSSTCRAILGSSVRSAAAATVPTSATVSATVS